MSTINQGLFQLLRIINNMADAGQYLTARQPNREVTSLGSFFGEIAERASTLTAKAGVRLTYTPPTREGMGNLDRDMAERAFYNLLSNALRFTPKGKTIQVVNVEFIDEAGTVCLRSSFTTFAKKELAGEEPFPTQEESLETVRAFFAEAGREMC